MPSATTPAMSLEAFQDFLDQFGENPATWPEGQRASAQALLDAMPAAQRAFADARAMRDGLKRRPVKAPERLLQTIDQRLTAAADESAAELPRVASGRV